MILYHQKGPEDSENPENNSVIIILGNVQVLRKALFGKIIYPTTRYVTNSFTRQPEFLYSILAFLQKLSFFFGRNLPICEIKFRRKFAHIDSHNCKIKFRENSKGNLILIF